MQFKFIGQNGSMGFLNGYIYDIELHMVNNQLYAVNRNMIIPYSNIAKFKENWRIIDNG